MRKHLGSLAFSKAMKTFFKFSSLVGPKMKAPMAMTTPMMVPQTELDDLPDLLLLERPLLLLPPPPLCETT